MFSWDAQKAQRNIEKHGISFEDAASIFTDPEALDWEDMEHPEAERRWRRLGISLRGEVLLAVYTLRRERDGTEKIRIISARRASSRERKAYAGFRD